MACCRLTSSETGEVDASSTLQHVTVAERPANGVPCNAISLGRQALSPSKHEASVADDLKSISADDDADDSIPFRLVLSSSPTLTLLIYFSCL